MMFGDYPGVDGDAGKGDPRDKRTLKFEIVINLPMT